GVAHPRVVGAVQRDPGPEIEVVDEVSLYGVEGVLGEVLAAEEVVVVGEERHAWDKLHRQGTQGLGDPELWLEGPAVGPDIHELVGVVLATGGRHLQAGPDDEIDRKSVV